MSFDDYLKQVGQTEEEWEKEQTVIIEELRMYDDDTKSKYLLYSAKNGVNLITPILIPGNFFRKKSAV